MGNISLNAEQIKQMPCHVPGLSHVKWSQTRSVLTLLARAAEADVS